MIDSFMTVEIEIYYDTKGVFSPKKNAERNRVINLNKIIVVRQIYLGSHYFIFCASFNLTLVNSKISPSPFSFDFVRI